MRATVLAPFVFLESRAATIRAAVASRQDVLQIRGDVATQALTLPAVIDENKTLRRLIGLSTRIRDGFVAAEIIPARGVEDDFSLTLNAGTAVGIVAFSPVVMADGIVGMVQSADATTSRVITWAHPDFRVSAMSVNEGALGIVQPHLGSGAERWLLELRAVPFRAKIDTGSLIVSSGLGGTYPRGIPIGTVLGEISTPEKWARTYLLRPAVLPAAIGPVLVLLPQRAMRGMNGVWTTLGSADSAARAVVAAGDSLARKAAFDELSARRAALDSAERVNRVDSLAKLPPGARVDSVRVDTTPRPRVIKPDTLRGRPTVPPLAGPLSTDAARGADVGARPA